jgi:two-component system, OmpR family, response regulator RegX3
MRVLIAEDDTDLLDFTTYALGKYGYTVFGVTDGITALKRWQDIQPDVVLLDVNLPGMSGMDVCRQIRQSSSTPIIMVTAMSDEDHIVQGFECGADDYVTKPLSYRTLVTRMRTVMQRRCGEAVVVQPSNSAEAGDIRVDLDAHEVLKGGAPIRMTRLETRILYFLVRNAGRIVQTSRLIELVWEYDGGDGFALKTHISHIRSKLQLNRGETGYISVVPLVGYKLENAERAQPMPHAAGSVFP